MEDNFDGVKVMVIDDSKTIRRTAETLLKKAGCEVTTAVDGFDGIGQNRGYITSHHLCRHHDATPGWLSNLCIDQE
jgi:hypothetical protein|tara:strand:+ start:23 stop:250 length:228 start_codon:yes stop_codon:yes gene_type:complete